MCMYVLCTYILFRERIMYALITPAAYDFIAWKWHRCLHLDDGNANVD